MLSAFARNAAQFTDQSTGREIALRKRTDDKVPAQRSSLAKVSSLRARGARQGEKRWETFEPQNDVECPPTENLGKQSVIKEHGSQPRHPTAVTMPQSRSNQLLCEEDQSMHQMSQLTMSQFSNSNGSSSKSSSSQFSGAKNPAHRHQKPEPKGDRSDDRRFWTMHDWSNHRPQLASTPTSSHIRKTSSKAFFTPLRPRKTPPKAPREAAKESSHHPIDTQGSIQQRRIVPETPFTPKRKLRIPIPALSARRQALLRKGVGFAPKPKPSGESNGSKSDSAKEDNPEARGKITDRGPGQTPEQQDKKLITQAMQMFKSFEEKIDAGKRAIDAGRRAIDAGKRAIDSVREEALQDINTGRDAAVSGIEGSKAKALIDIDAGRNEVISGIKGSKEEALQGINSGRNEAISGIQGSKEEALQGIDTSRNEAVSGVERSKGKALRDIKEGQNRAVLGIEGCSREKLHAIADAAARIQSEEEDRRLAAFGEAKRSLMDWCIQIARTKVEEMVNEYISANPFTERIAGMMQTLKGSGQAENNSKPIEVNANHPPQTRKRKRKAPASRGDHPIPETADQRVVGETNKQQKKLAPKRKRKDITPKVSLRRSLRIKNASCKASTPGQSMPKQHEVEISPASVSIATRAGIPLAISNQKKGEVVEPPHEQRDEACNTSDHGADILPVPSRDRATAHEDALPDNTPVELPSTPAKSSRESFRQSPVLVPSTPPSAEKARQHESTRVTLQRNKRRKRPKTKSVSVVIEDPFDFL